jgi:hypothetical protein
MEYIDMAKYFEAVNPNNESIVIDDTFMCLELRGVFPLSDFRRYPGDSYYDPCYKQKHNLGGGILWGFGLNGLAGKSFCPEIIMTALDSVSVYFRNPNAGDFHKDKILRDDITASAKLYAFSLDARSPTEHMTGLEVYNDLGKVVYSSAYGHLHVLACGCENEVTISHNGSPVVFVLGEDISYDYHVSRKEGIVGAEYAMYPQITVGDNSVSIKKITKMIAYAGDINKVKKDPEHEHYRGSGFAFGWLLGEVI